MSVVSLRRALSVLAGTALILACGCTGRTGDVAETNNDVDAGDNQNDDQVQPPHDGGTTSDAAFVEVPDPLSGDNPTYPLESVAAPGPGESVYDSRLGTTQTRVVETLKLRHEYSRYDTFNLDQSMILLLDFDEGDFRVYRTDSVPYDQAENLVTTLSVEEPRWDPNDPHQVWGISELQVVTTDVVAGETATAKDFTDDPVIGPIITANPDLYRVTRQYEGEASIDMRYWAFILQGTQEDYRARYLFTWDREKDEILGLYELSAEESVIDWVGMSPLGNWVIIGGDYDNGGNIGPGLRIVNREFTSPFYQLAHATAHADVGLDTDGNEVIVMQNTQTDHVELFPLEPDADPVPLMILFYDADSPLGFSGGIHVSCNMPGYCIVSTEVDAAAPEQNWFDRMITLVELDRNNPRVFYLAKVYGSTGAYWEETQATITNDGTKVIWATNWSENVGDEDVWVMELDMPANWTATLAD
ncbi:MAG: hypothetical protein JSV19_13015 [Phycisphaerales bacterium]|nr:MAG: hypothetical protein JSV19_13015 [Phycisphaerales bacterium]